MHTWRISRSPIENYHWQKMLEIMFANGVYKAHCLCYRVEQLGIAILFGVFRSSLVAGRSV